MIACCVSVGFGFSTLPDDAVDELFDVEFVPDPPDPDNCFSLSPRPQNVSAKVISPNDKIDFILIASGWIERSLNIVATLRQKINLTYPIMPVCYNLENHAYAPAFW